MQKTSTRDWTKVGRVLRRIGANLAALAVGGVAARATWDHIAHVGQKYGEPMAAWLPISVDGMMVVGVIMAADARAAGRPIGPWSRAATWVGGVLSVAAQIESGRERGWVAAGIATVFSLTLIITVEALFWRGKAKVVKTEVAEPVQTPTAVTEPVEVQVATAIAATSAELPAPVSPGPVRTVAPGRSRDRVPGTGPIPRRAMVSPLRKDDEGKPVVLLDRAAKI